MWWWRAGLDGYRSRPRWIGTSIQLFFAFMFFNAAIVFGSPLMRWFGTASILIILVLLGVRSRSIGARSSPIETR